MQENDTEMIVKRVSVPVGLEELMEGLSKEVLLKKPKDLYVFASEYFTRLILMRERNNQKAYSIRTVQSITQIKHAEIYRSKKNTHYQKNSSKEENLLIKNNNNGSKIPNFINKNRQIIKSLNNRVKSNKEESFNNEELEIKGKELMQSKKIPKKNAHNKNNRVLKKANNFQENVEKTADVSSRKENKILNKDSSIANSENIKKIEKKSAGKAKNTEETLEKNVEKKLSAKKSEEIPETAKEIKETIIGKKSDRKPQNNLNNEEVLEIIPEKKLSAKKIAGNSENTEEIKEKIPENKLDENKEAEKAQSKIINEETLEKTLEKKLSAEKSAQKPEIKKESKEKILGKKSDENIEVEKAPSNLINEKVAEKNLEKKLSAEESAGKSENTEEIKEKIPEKKSNENKAAENTPSNLIIAETLEKNLEKKLSSEKSAENSENTEQTKEKIPEKKSVENKEAEKIPSNLIIEETLEKNLNKKLSAEKSAEKREPTKKINDKIPKKEPNENKAIEEGAENKNEEEKESSNSTEDAQKPQITMKLEQKGSDEILTVSIIEKPKEIDSPEIKSAIIIEDGSISTTISNNKSEENHQLQFFRTNEEMDKEEMGIVKNSDPIILTRFLENEQKNVFFKKSALSSETLIIAESSNNNKSSSDEESSNKSLQLIIVEQNNSSNSNSTISSNSIRIKRNATEEEIDKDLPIIIDEQKSCLKNSSEDKDIKEKHSSVVSFLENINNIFKLNSSTETEEKNASLQQFLENEHNNVFIKNHKSASEDDDGIKFRSKSKSEEISSENVNLNAENPRSAGRRPLVRQMETNSKELEEQLKKNNVNNEVILIKTIQKKAEVNGTEKSINIEANANGKLSDKAVENKPNAIKKAIKSENVKNTEDTKKQKHEDEIKTIEKEVEINGTKKPVQIEEKTLRLENLDRKLKEEAKAEENKPGALKEAEKSENKENTADAKKQNHEDKIEIIQKETEVNRTEKSNEIEEKFQKLENDADGKLNEKSEAEGIKLEALKETGKPENKKKTEDATQQKHEDEIKTIQKEVEVNGTEKFIEIKEKMQKLKSLDGKLSGNVVHEENKPEALNKPGKSENNENTEDTKKQKREDELITIQKEVKVNETEKFQKLEVLDGKLSGKVVDKANKAEDIKIKHEDKIKTIKKDVNDVTEKSIEIEEKKQKSENAQGKLNKKTETELNKPEVLNEAEKSENNKKNPEGKREEAQKNRTNNDEEAATKIQSAWKGFNTRKTLKTQQKAAIKIQALVRGFLIKNKPKPQHQDKFLKPDFYRSETVEETPLIKKLISPLEEIEEAKKNKEDNNNTAEETNLEKETRVAIKEILNSLEKNCSSTESAESVITVKEPNNKETRTALEDHVELLDEVQNSLLDQLSGKKMDLKSKSFNIDDKTLLEMNNPIIMNDVMEYLYPDFHPEIDLDAEEANKLEKDDETAASMQQNMTIIRELTDIAEEAEIIMENREDQEHILKHTSEFHDTVMLNSSDFVDSGSQTEESSSSVPSDLHQHAPGAEASVTASRRLFNNDDDDADHRTQTLFKYKKNVSTQSSSSKKPEQINIMEKQFASSVESTKKNHHHHHHHHQQNNNKIEKNKSAKENDEKMEIENAATKIQAGFRGYKVRKELNKQNNALEQKRQLRKRNSREISIKEAEIEEKSAVKIQAGVRGFLVRRRQKKNPHLST